MGQETPGSALTEGDELRCVSLQALPRVSAPAPYADRSLAALSRLTFPLLTLCKNSLEEQTHLYRFDDNKTVLSSL